MLHIPKFISENIFMDCAPYGRPILHTIKAEIWCEIKECILRYCKKTLLPITVSLNRANLFKCFLK